MHFTKTNPLAIMPAIHSQNTKAHLFNPTLVCMEPYTSYTIDLLLQMVSKHPCRIIPPLQSNRPWFHINKYSVTGENGNLILKIRNESPYYHFLLPKLNLGTLWEQPPKKNPIRN